MTADEGRAWDWTDDAGDVVVPEQPAVAVYLNPKGDVVLRQRGDVFDDDSWIWFGSEHAIAIAGAILEAAGIAPELAPGPATSCGDTRPKDSTAARRQKRYRERKKKELTPDIFDRDDRDDRDVTRNGVTPRDGVTA